MANEKWAQVKEVFDAALRHKPEDRAAFLDEVCAADEAVRREVESLLSSFDHAEGFMAKPVVGELAEAPTIKRNVLAKGHRLGHYEIIEQIGAGGMGEVYLAEDTQLERTVALKVLPIEVAADRERMRRFVQEAKAVSALNHPNIITIHEIRQFDGTHFIAIEYVKGETLRERLKRESLTLAETLDLAVQIAAALSAAHEAGIVHRDIKPENIMLRADGLVKVLDFGLAKLTARRHENLNSEAATRAQMQTQPGMILGTVAYMSPEQARGRAVDARTDIFSLGVVCYEMLTGRLPFAGETTSDVLAAILKSEPAPLTECVAEVPKELERIVNKALRKNREERYQHSKDLLIDLRDLKQELEFAAKLERTAAPAKNGQVTAGQAAAATERQNAQTTSSAEYLVNQVKRYKRGTIVVMGMLALAAVTLFWFFNQTRATPILTDKDTIVLAHFVNTTGDAVFDDTLKQALAIALEQSPFFNIFSDQRVRETLRFMNRSPDERITKDVAREICQRQGLKAYLVGAISNFGSHYVITLEAVNAQTGDPLARQQVEAESKEQVLGALGQSAIKLREKLGESLASIQKYDAPIEQVTTSSLDALKAYSLGRELHLKGKEPEAIPLIKRAIELDPNFARAYDALSYSYGNIRQTELAREAAQKAFELRDRASEYEKLKAESNYYTVVTGETEKAIETLELLTRTYPRDYMARNSLANRYNASGRYERAIEEAREAVRLNPNLGFAYIHIASGFTRLNRFDEAKEVYEQALAQKLNRTGYHTGLYLIAFVQGDTAAMQQQLDWARGKPDEYVMLYWQANTAAFLGQMRRSRALYQRSADAALSRSLKEEVADIISWDATTAAVTGNCQQAREDAARASALPRTNNSFSGIGFALALCGEPGPAQAFAGAGAKQFPKDTIVNAVWLPAIRAAIEIRRNDPVQAIQFLRSADRYDTVGAFFPEYLRGQAYLAQGVGAAAAAEFQKILERRGLAPASVLYPLARLGLARAALLQGDSAKARVAYQDFFALWKDADGDIPILLEAKKEYEKLK